MTALPNVMEICPQTTTLWPAEREVACRGDLFAGRDRTEDPNVDDFHRKEV